ncbi:DegV family protein [Microbispora triticiradicis]|uniref:DegV family protein n=2 Tax=Microbispora TaxID=2005 RepID=A0ABY3LTW9_9ACTN|nr:MULTISPECIES: DegV family protein [Microbispora]TLP58769.1 DegV family protein [Microbispora fusca]TYB53846.1 DegV family protein [Microbispora tritici]GLW21471.1 DegV domain-containing protein [Microbispora amethystogenes]
MSPSVAVVTDSTAYLGAEATGRWNVTVVPVQVILGDHEIDDVTPFDAGLLAHALQGRSPIVTSRPSPERFAEAYERAAAAGATEIVSVHLSGALSGTVDSARLAAREAPVPVQVVDSRSIAMGLGFAVLAAARAAGAGAPAAEVAAVASGRAAASETVFYVDTLEYLRRGGRIGRVANLLGSALSIKPLLRLADGEITVLEKVRTASRALARLEDLVVEEAGERPVDVAVQHLMAAERAEALMKGLTARLPRLVRMWVVEIGPVLGAHTGPGVLGVTIAPGVAD